MGHGDRAAASNLFFELRMTEPLDPSTLPKRHGNEARARMQRSHLGQHEFGGRLLAPITLVGFTALSVLMRNKTFDTGLCGGQRHGGNVPKVLLRTQAVALARPSIIGGTCLNAAAWNTRCGRCCPRPMRRC